MEKTNPKPIKPPPKKQTTNTTNIYDLLDNTEAILSKPKIPAKRKKCTS
jgi:hypothetical protein